MNSSLLSSSSLLNSGAVFLCNQSVCLLHFQRHSTWGTCLSNMATSTLFRSQRILPLRQTAACTGFRWVASSLKPLRGSSALVLKTGSWGNSPGAVVVRPCCVVMLIIQCAGKRRKGSTETPQASSPGSVCQITVYKQTVICRSTKLAYLFNFKIAVLSSKWVFPSRS